MSTDFLVADENKNCTQVRNSVEWEFYLSLHYDICLSSDMMMKHVLYRVLRYKQRLTCTMLSTCTYSH